ncbi:hypothetical protein HS088_TW18G00865 [Tripterygium wilfordii]|uniref:Uncharacterized protein n=1 Tax=Tripterygium wilfordii TaxID=458696 RepID=A0A7J7CE20_TRIWF|nr:uncharacterized protein LOC119983480 [Tripterygium wilfordii]KAF5732175.1 hypothetical protein HS088_TW18G00865 [Tripterygium wilfordii]
MNPSTTRTALLVTLLILSFFTIRTNWDRIWSAFYGSPIFLPVFGVILASALLVMAVRATIVTWITVLVLLACAGNRRRVLVRQGSKITTDVAMYLVKVVVREKGLVAVACATLVSFMAMIRIAEAGFY